jgi:hypothetical protein
MYIYRIQNKNNEGPYQAENVTINDWAITNHEDNYHLDPRADGIDFKYGVHKCAFNSLNKLNQWFSKQELTNLHDLGFYIYRLEISRVLVGKLQVAYNPKDITSQTILNY